MPILIALFTFLVAIFLWYAIGFLHRKYCVRRLAKQCRDKRILILSYDDGPSLTLTSRLLKLLEKYDARAVFFVLGSFVKDNQKVFQQVVSNGHQIGSHTYDHSNAWKTGPITYLKDVQSGIQTLEGAKIKTQLFRPPFGKATLGLIFFGWIKSLRLAYWTIDTRDSWNRRPIEDVTADLKSLGGGVVLMHDRENPLRGPTPEDHPEYLLALTEALIKTAHEENIKIVGFEEIWS